MQTQSKRSPSGKVDFSVQESIEGITLLSDASESPSDEEDPDEKFQSVIQYQQTSNRFNSQNVHPNTQFSTHGNQNDPLEHDDEYSELLFQVTPNSHSSNYSHSHSKSNKDDDQLLDSNHKILDQISYNDTLSYLEDYLGQTYLNNLSKNSVIQQNQHQPPKIQSSSTCTKVSNKIEEKNQKQPNPIKINQKQPLSKTQKHQKHPDNNQNPFIKKVQSKRTTFIEQPSKKQVPQSKKNKKSKDEKKIDKKRDLSTNKSVSKIKQTKTKQTEQVKDKSLLKVKQHKHQTKKFKQKGDDYNHHEQMIPNYYQEYPYHPNHQQKGGYQQYPPSHMGYPPYQQMQYYNKHNPYPPQFDDPYYKQAQYQGPGQYFIPGYKRKKQRPYNERYHRQNYDVVNGWHYPHRGNVMYDQKQRPWILEEQMTIEDRYFADLMKRQYLTHLEKQALSSYMARKNQYSQYMSSFSSYSSPYDNPPNNGANIIPNDFYQPSNSINTFSQPSNNSQISTKTTPLNPKPIVTERSTRQPDQKTQSRVNEVKIIPKQQVKIIVREQVRIPSSILRKQHTYQRKQQPPQKIRPQLKQSQKIVSKILPSDILKHETFHQQQPIQPPFGFIKSLDKNSSKSVVILLYNIPIIVSNEQIKNQKAQIFLVPYSHLMIQQNQPSKWIEYLQKSTGIDIMKKLAEMNGKEVQEKGRDIPQGTVSKIKLSRKLNFSSIYLVKLTNFMDQESKKPYGQTLLKESFSKIVQNFIGGSQSSSNAGKSLLIHGGYFPGVMRNLTPRLIANFLYIALANASLEHKMTERNLKIIINVPKQEEYLEYVQQFRKVLNEYRKLQSI